MDDYRNNIIDQKNDWTLQLTRVFGWMFIGLIVTAVAAYATLASGIIFQMNSTTIIILAIAEVALVWFLSARVLKMEYITAVVSFLAYSALNGITLSTIFFIYTTASIVYVFLISAVIFGFMGVYGLITKTDLSSFGSIFFMGLIGIVIASLVNMFLRSSGLDWVITLVGIAVFLGLTAYDTQKIKEMYASNSQLAASRNLAIIGALKLYLDFINLFLFVLRLLGKRR